MKRMLICLLLIAGAAGLKAQEAAAPAFSEPQYINSFYAMDAAGKLIRLEHTLVRFHASTKAFPGYASVKMSAQFKPDHSPVRLPGNMQFVIREGTQVDPLLRYELRQLKVSHDHREFVLTSSHGSLFTGGTTSVEGIVPLRVEEFGEASYRITPEHPLAPGEYALAVRGRVGELHCFGVDP